MNEKDVIMRVMDLLADQKRFNDKVLSRLQNNSPDETDLITLYENFCDDNPVEMYRQLSSKFKDKFIDAVAIETGLVMSPDEAFEDEFCPVCGDFLDPMGKCLNCGWSINQQ